MGSHLQEEGSTEAQEVVIPVDGIGEPKGSVESGDYLAVLFDPARGWGPLVARLAADYPHWISSPTTPEDRERILYGLVSNPMNLAWEVWRGEQIVGIILLTDLSPLVDARLHFAFFDHNLVSKTRLLRRFLAYCFTDLRFQRISVQVPEFFGTLLSYYRRKLHFKYEGESAVKEHPTVAQMRQRSPGDDVHVWIAKSGSRRERAHWHKDKWHDVLCLRVMASEFDSQGVPCPPLPSSPPSPPSPPRSSVTR